MGLDPDLLGMNKKKFAHEQLKVFGVVRLAREIQFRMERGFAPKSKKFSDAIDVYITKTLRLGKKTRFQEDIE